MIAMLPTIPISHFIHNFPSISIGSQSKMTSSAQITAHDPQGYLEPDVPHHYMSRDRVRRLLANDPVVRGLTVFELSEVWIHADKEEYIRRAIRDSKYLHTLEIFGLENIQTFLPWLADNRSIEHLSIQDLNTIEDLKDELDIFEILVPFFEHNINLRCIEMSYDFKHAPPDFSTF